MPYRGLEICLVSALFSIGALAAEPYIEEPPPAGAEPKAFAVIGDTQRTLWYEKLFLFRENNEAGARELLAKLKSEEPAFVIHLGDMVNHGGKEAEWSFFDELFRPLGVPMLPLAGNHEYWGGNPLNSKIRERFPKLAAQTFHVHRYGPLGLIRLDSNFDELDNRVWAEQVAWFTRALVELEREPDCRAILVFSHHPPYSNNKVTGSADWMRRAFETRFLQSRKTLAWISGHAHGYEHFSRDGRLFLVSGGGGGPRGPVKQGKAAESLDEYTGPYPRPLHYLMVHINPNGLEIQVSGIETIRKLFR